MFFRLCLTLATLLASSAFTTLPALAESRSAEVTCASSTLSNGITSCDGYTEATFTSESPDLIYGIVLRAPATHCSPVAYAVTRAPYATGEDVIATTEFVNAGEGGAIPIGRGWSAGAHTLRVSAVGAVAGCNTGVLQSWGVEWEVVITPE